MHVEMDDKAPGTLPPPPGMCVSVCVSVCARACVCEKEAMFQKQYLSNQSELGQCCFAGLKGLYESFLTYQVLCHHSKYSLSGGQNESRLGIHGKIPHTSTWRTSH